MIYIIYSRRRSLTSLTVHGGDPRTLLLRGDADGLELDIAHVATAFNKGVAFHAEAATPRVANNPDGNAFDRLVTDDDDPVIRRAAAASANDTVVIVLPRFAVPIHEDGDGAVVHDPVHDLMFVRDIHGEHREVREVANARALLLADVGHVMSGRVL